MNHILRRAAAIAALGSLLLPFTDARADSMRCGARLVSTGDTQAQVQRHCGEPAQRHKRSILVPIQDVWGNSTLVEKQVEEWVYSEGSHRLDQHLTFEDGVLTTVRSGKYGG